MSYYGNPGHLFYKMYTAGYDFLQDADKKDEKFFEERNKNLTKNFEFTSSMAYDIPCGQGQDFTMITTYPGLLCGSGYPHGIANKSALKIGFFFDFTSGLPVIPGSSVKGTLRSVFPGKKPDDNALKKMSESEQEKSRITRENKALYIKETLNTIGIEIEQEGSDLTDMIYRIEMEIFEGRIIGEDGKESAGLSLYKRDFFMDAGIVNTSHNNQFNNQIFAEDTICPHTDGPLKNPTPLNFLKVLPDVTFKFNFDLKDRNIITELDSSKKLELFEHILMDFGVGAKTNVGYGQFAKPPIIIPKNIIPLEASQYLKDGNEIKCKISDSTNDYYFFTPEQDNLSECTFVKKKEQSLKKVRKKYGTTEFNIGDMVIILIQHDHQINSRNLNFQVIDLIK